MPTDNETPVLPSKADVLKNIGRNLEEKRKARGWTIEKVGQNIKIRASFVKALEEGNWQDLPGEVYGRGFASRYAQLVGLDPKELLRPYMELLNSVNEKSEKPRDIAPGFEFPRSGFIWSGVALIVFVAVIKFITADLKSAKNLSSQVMVPKNENVVIRTSSATSTNALIPHSLHVFSPLPLWLSVKTESKSFEGFIPQASTWMWKGDGIFNVRLGHTQQVVLSFDGRWLPLTENQKKLSLPE